MAKLKINRGTTYTRTLTYYKDGVLTPLTGMTVFFTVKSNEYDQSANDSTAVVQRTLSNLNDANAAMGKAIIVLVPDDTDLLTPGDYYYDIKVKESTDVIYKVDEGTISLDGSPTNRLT